MSKLEKAIVLVVCLLPLTLFCSYIGDDDVIYQFLYRKPTPHESLARLRWVILKIMTSIYGGFVLSAAVRKFLAACFSVSLTDFAHAQVVLACIGVVALFIGLLQNAIRYASDRPLRPVIDPIVWRRSRGGPLPPDARSNPEN
jgi:hypothetical protein